MTIKASRGRLLVRLLPVMADTPNTLKLTLIDNKKHFDHASRKGVVVSVGSGIFDVAVSDVVVFRGDAGFSLDGDPETQRPEFGEAFRWLKKEDVLALEDRPSPLPESEIKNQEATR